jgi:hypothetical protein
MITIFFAFVLAASCIIAGEVALREHKDSKLSFKCLAESVLCNVVLILSWLSVLVLCGLLVLIGRLFKSSKYSHIVVAGMEFARTAEEKVRGIS